MKKMGSWIQLEENEFFMEPYSTLEVPFTITIPLDSDSGESAGAFMMHKFDPETNERPSVIRPGGIRLQFRTGVRIYNTTNDPVIEKIIAATILGAQRTTQSIAFIYRNSCYFPLNKTNRNHYYLLINNLFGYRHVKNNHVCSNALHRRFHGCLSNHG